MSGKPPHNAQQHTNDTYAPGNDLIVAFFTHFAHNAMHFSDHVFDMANFLFHCFYLEFQHAVTFSTQLHVCFKTFLFNISGINHVQAPMAYLWLETKCFD